MNDLRVVAGEVSKLICERTEYFVGWLDSWGSQVEICDQIRTKRASRVIGAIYFFGDMSTVYRRHLSDNNANQASCRTDKEIGSVVYCDPGFFNKIIDLVRGL